MKPKLKSKQLKERPTRSQAEEAVRTLIAWAGDDPARDGLRKTPSRVVCAYDEYFSGYQQDPDQVLADTLEEIEAYDGIILLKNMRLASYCEHHMVAFVGRAHVAYMPNERMVGISKLARVVDIYSKRLQIQERLCLQIAQCIDRMLKPKGVGVVIDASHQCMTTRGVHKAGSHVLTQTMLGLFKENPETRLEFMTMINRTE